MSDFNWRRNTPDQIAAAVHDFALRNGRCVVFMHGDWLTLRMATDARNARDMDDEVGQFDCRSKADEIITKIYGSVPAAITEGNR